MFSGECWNRPVCPCVCVSLHEILVFFCLYSFTATVLTLSHIMTPFDGSGKEDFWKHCGKRRNCLYKQFLPFAQFFLLYQREKLSFLLHLLSVDVLNLVWSKILSSGNELKVYWLVVVGFNATLTDKVISWWDTCISWFSHTSTNNFSFWSHRLLFSHASAEVRGENTPARKVISTGDWT